MLRFAEQLEVGAAATNPVKYLVPEDAFLADALECMRKIVPIAQEPRQPANAEGWLKPARAMRSLFVERPDLCDATLGSPRRCRFDLGLKQIHFPTSRPRRGVRSAVLAERCRRGIEARGRAAHPGGPRSPQPGVAMIQTWAPSAFFLIWPTSPRTSGRWAWCACRGSAAGSLVCYLTRSPTSTRSATACCSSGS